MKDDGTDVKGHTGTSHKKRDQRKHRMVHISDQVVNGSTKLQQNYEGAIELWAKHLVETGGPVEQKPKVLTKKKTEENHEPEDRILATVHHVKKWLERIWRWTKCYTQYCYPGLRTVEYYRKLNDHQTRKKKPGNDHNGKYLGDSGNKPSDHKSNQASREKLSSTTSIGQEAQNFHHLIGDASQLFAVSPKNPQPIQPNIGWLEQVTKRTSDIVETAMLPQSGQSSSIFAIRKWICILLIPVVLLLGAHHCLLRRQYKSLTDKLSRVKSDNCALTAKSKKLKKKLLTSENKHLPLATIRSRAEVLAEMTMLSESLIKSLETINLLASQKADLLNKLKSARRKQGEKEYFTHFPQTNNHMIS